MQQQNRKPFRTAGPRVVFRVVRGARWMKRAVVVAFVALVAVGGWRLAPGPVSEPFPRSPSAEPPVSREDDGDGRGDAVPALAGVTVSVSAQPIPVPGTGHPFAGLRLERERQRARELEVWAAAAADMGKTPAERQRAATALQQLWTAARQEAELEHILAAEGFKTWVTVEGDRLRIVVDGVLDASEAARLGELASRVAGVARHRVTVVDSFSPGG